MYGSSKFFRDSFYCLVDTYIGEKKFLNFRIWHCVHAYMGYFENEHQLISGNRPSSSFASCEKRNKRNSKSDQVSHIKRQVTPNVDCGSKQARILKVTFRLLPCFFMLQYCKSQSRKLPKSQSFFQGFVRQTLGTTFQSFLIFTTTSLLPALDCIAFGKAYHNYGFR